MESRTQGSRPRPGTPKNFEAKNRPSRGQGQGPLDRRKCSPKRTQTQVFSKKKKKVFKNFSGSLYLKKPKKKSLQIFCKVSSVFQQNFSGSKIVLSSSRGQGKFRGLEASKPKPRTSKSVLEDVLEAKDILDDSTSAKSVFSFIPYNTIMDSFSTHKFYLIVNTAKILVHPYKKQSKNFCSHIGFDY